MSARPLRSAEEGAAPRPRLGARTVCADPARPGHPGAATEGIFLGTGVGRQRLLPKVGGGAGGKGSPDPLTSPGPRAPEGGGDVPERLGPRPESPAEA